MLKLLICASVLGVTFAAEDEQQQVEPKFALPCNTPNDDEGLCVEVRKCSVFMQALMEGRTDNHDFMRASRCGLPNVNPSRPNVCCGIHANYLFKSTTSLPRPTSTTTVPKKGDGGKNPFPNVCGHQKLQTLSLRIVGGRTAEIGEFPWMARLQHRRKDGILNYGCAGFLITKQFVLTAAHCIRSLALAPLGPVFQVQLGEHNTQTDPDCMRTLSETKCADSPLLVRTAKPKVHPEYSNDVEHHNDIAVIPLKKIVEFTDYVQPICLAEKLSLEKEMWLSGWGKTDTAESSAVKLKVAIDRANNTRCANTYRTVHVRILQSQLCAGGDAGRDSCSGDSGGPLMVQRGSEPWTAEGVVSFGMGCGLQGWPGVYTSIPEYRPWIKKVINRHLQRRENKIKQKAVVKN